MPKLRGTRKCWKSAGVSRKSISPDNVERVETVDCVRSYAEEVAAQYVKHLLGLSSSLLAR
jgi:hypothetical protein